MAGCADVRVRTATLAACLAGIAALCAATAAATGSERPARAGRNQAGAVHAASRQGVWLPAPSAAPAAADRPNIVLILTDDQRWDTLWAMPKVRADLVDHGVTFDNGFVVNSLCCPSRTSILTGTYSHSTGVYTNEPPYGGFQAFHGDHSTIATWLQAAGYKTALVGKYLNQYQMLHYVPPGWDHWFAFANVGYYGYTMNRNGRFQSYGSKPSDYSTDVLASDAESFIAGADPAKPLLLYFAPHAPHTPVIPAPKYAHAFSDLPPWRPPNFDEQDVSTKPEWVRRLARFGADEDRKIDDVRLGMLRTLLSVDDAVDGIVQMLAATGRLSNTMLVFMSDNGYAWGEHRWVGKQDAYEESIRVPYVVRYDPLTGTPRTDRHLVTNIDLAPTFASVAGVPAPGVEGRSLLPLLTSPDAPWRHEFLIEHEALADSYPITTFCAVRTDRYLYVDYASHEEELYDVSADPYELVNMVDDPGHAGVLNDLRDQVRTLCRPPPPHWSFGTGGAHGPSPPPSSPPPRTSPPPVAPPSPTNGVGTGAPSLPTGGGSGATGTPSPAGAAGGAVAAIGPPGSGAARGRPDGSVAGSLAGLAILVGVVFGPTLLLVATRRRR
jgi:N-acetylglucosamine-6-sulfatase